jgi:Uma2 family endonuclease
MEAWPESLVKKEMAMSVAILAPEQPTTKPKPQPAAPLRMSYEEWLDWTEEDQHAEWVNGEVIIFMPAKTIHQILVAFLNKLLGLFVEIHELGIVQIAPFEVKLPQGNSREPDLLFLHNDHIDQMTSERILGAPDLVVEVVSDESAHRDRVDKFDEYEAAGVPEYWVLDNRPGRNRAYFYQLDAGGRYQPVLVGADGIYRARALPGFWLKVDWLWGEEPNALRALAALIGPEQMAAALRRAAE